MRVAIIGNGYLAKSISIALNESAHEFRLFSRSKAEKQSENTSFFKDYNELINLVTIYEPKIIISAFGTSKSYEVDENSLEFLSEVNDYLDSIMLAALKTDSRIIFLSSAGTIYGDWKGGKHHESLTPAPISAYGKLKSRQEEKLYESAENSDLKINVLRVSNPYGIVSGNTSYAGFINQAILKVVTSKPLNIFGSLDQARDFIHVNDFSHLVKTAIEIEDLPRCINLGSGQSVTLREIVKLVELKSGLELSLKFYPKRETDVQAVHLDVGLMEKHLGLTKVSLGEGILKTLEQMKSLFIW